jgi:hypothetical protein
MLTWTLHSGRHFLILAMMLSRRRANGAEAVSGIVARGDEAVRAFAESHPLGWIEALRRAVRESHPQGCIDGILGVAEASLASLSADLR